MRIKDLIFLLEQSIEKDCVCKACQHIPYAIAVLKRIDVEKIEKVYYKNQGNSFLSEHHKNICRAIVNYLTGVSNDPKE